MKKLIDIPDEIWVDIIGYEGFYKLSNLGRVKKLESKKRLNNGDFMSIPETILITNSKKNYPSVALNKSGEIKTYSMHRLLAKHFLKNDDPINKKEVNHKNKNIYDFSLNNLEWCTRSYNVKYGKNSCGKIE